MRLNIYFAVVLSLLVLACQAKGSDVQKEVDLINKVVESENGTEPGATIDAESARRILAHFMSTNERWKHFLSKIRRGESGAIVTALTVIGYATSEAEVELRFALQETLIDAPEIVLSANQKAKTPLSWVCGKPASENYDLVEHLVNGRIEALSEMIAAMDSPDERIRQLYSEDLRPVAKDCLEMIHTTSKKK